MQPKVVTKHAFTVVGMQIHTTPMNPAIAARWGEFAPRMDEVQQIAEPHVSFDLMGRYDEDMSCFDYMDGVSVKSTEVLPPGMTTWEMPASTYAVFDATLATLGDVFGQIYNNWLPTSGYQPATDICFERYGETFNPQDPTSPLSIYIPVEKKA